MKIHIKEVLNDDINEETIFVCFNCGQSTNVSDMFVNVLGDCVCPNCYEDEFKNS